MGLAGRLLSIVSSDVRAFHDDPSLQAFVHDSIERYGIKTFFETGSFRGDTLSWMARHEKTKNYSVENWFPYWFVSELRLHGRANIYLGDSRDRLWQALPWLEQPIMFWLDAHWRGNNPLAEEVNLIRRSGKRSIILIDDMDSPAIGTQKVDRMVGDTVPVGVIDLI